MGAVPPSIRKAVIAALVCLGGAVQAAAPTLDWSATWSRSWGGEDSWAAALTDSSGNTLVAVEHLRSAGKGDGPGGSPTVLLQFNSAGMLAARTPVPWGDGQGCLIRTMARDGAGALLVTGVDWRDSRRITVASLDPATSAVNWQGGANAFPSGNVTCEALLIDSSGNVVAAGTWQDWGGMGSTSKGFAALFTSTGSPVWSVSVTGLDEVLGAAADGYGSIYLAGSRMQGGSNRTFAVSQLGPSGSLGWTRTISAAAYRTGAVAVFDAGSNALFVCGGGSGPVTVRRLDPATGVEVSVGTLPVPFPDHYVGSVTRDAAGNLWVAGSFVAGGLGNIFVAGFDASLAPIPGSLRTFASGKDDGGIFSTTSKGASRLRPAVSVGCDSSGNVFVSAGAFVSCGSLDTGSDDVIVSRWTASGPAVWTRVYDGPAKVQTVGVVRDAFGRIVVAGQTERWPGMRMYSPDGALLNEVAFTTTQFCDLTLNAVATHRASGVTYLLVDVQPANGRSGSLIVVYDANLVQQAVYGIFDPGQSISVKCGTTDDAGNLYVQGSFESNGNSTPIAGKFGAGGPEWNVPLTTPGGGGESGGISVDAWGNSYVVISDKGEGGPSGGQGYLFKISPTGTILWTQPGPVNSQFSGVRADGASVYVSGMIMDPMVGIWGVVGKWDAAGNNLWTREYHGSQPVQAFFGGLDLDEDGNVLAAGAAGVYTMTFADFDLHTASYDPDGNLRWERVWDSGDPVDWATGITAGSAYVCGQNGTSGLLIKYTEPCARLAASLAAEPSPAGAADWTRVVLTVTNTGLLDATTVVPALDVNSGAALATMLGSPSAAPLAAGASASFTWTVSVNGSGVIRFTATAFGAEAGSGKLRIAAASRTVPAGVRLISSLATIPDPTLPPVGGWFQVVLTVTNTGGSPLTSATAMMQSNGGTAVLAIVGKPSMPTTLLPGASMDLVWTLSISAAGSVNWTFSATGFDPVGVRQSAGRSLVTGVGYGASNLSSYLSFSNVSAGAPLTAWLTVTNSGTVTLNNATASIAVNQGTIAPVCCSWPPGPVTIPAGGTRTFTWTFATGVPGAVSLTATVVGNDAGSGVGRTLAASASGVIAPSALTGGLSGMPSFAMWKQGMTATLYLSVTNTGANDLNVLMPDLVVNFGGPVFTILSPPPPIPTLAAGASGVFAWTVSITGIGTVDLTVTVTGTDAVTGTTAGIVRGIRQSMGFGASSLRATLATSAWIENGSPMTVWLTVSNAGNDAAQNVVPAMWTTDGGWRVGPPGPVSPVGPQTIPAGGRVTFTWSIPVWNNGWGPVSVSASATGQDAGTFVPAWASASGIAQISRSPEIYTSLSVSPNNVPLGALVELVLTVTNSGGIPWVGATSYVDTECCADGQAVLMASPFGAVDIYPGSSHSFTWTFSVTGSGSVMFRGWASGTDFVNGESRNFWAPRVTLEGEMASNLAFSPSPDNTFIGDICTVYLTVTNTASVPMVNVAASPPGCCVSQIVPMSGPIPAGLPSLAPGASQTFVWTYSVVGTGYVNLTPTVTGTGSGGLPVLTRKSWGGTVGKGAAVLSTAITMDTPTRGEQLHVWLTVTNSGTNDFVNAVPELDLNGNSWLLSPVAGPSATSYTIAKGTSQVMGWTFSTSGSGMAFLNVRFDGYDFGTANYRNVWIPFSATVYDPPPAVLEPAFSIAPAAPTVGQLVTFCLNVRNTGAGRATNVSPSLDINSGYSRISSLRGPFPSGASSLDPGGVVAFVWTATVTGVGEVGMGWRVEADHEGPYPHMNYWGSTMFAISGPVAHLVSQLDSDPDPGRRMPGEWFSIFLTVTNDGTAAANNVTPSFVVNVGATVLTVESSASGSLTLPPGAGTTFAWTFSVNGAGAVCLTFSAAGTDAGSGTPLVTSQVGAGNLGYGRGELELAIHASPLTLYDTETVTLTVTNVGNAAIASIVPALASDGGPGSLVPTGGPWPAGVAALPPGGSTTFSWIATAFASGSAYISAFVSGTSQPTGDPMGWSASRMVPIAPLGRLTGWLSVVPNPALPGQWVNVVLTVSSTGDRPVQNVTPFLQVNGNSGNIAYESGPNPPGPVLLNVHESRSFVWTYSVNGIGAVPFTVTAMGSDMESGALRVVAQTGVIASGGHLVSAVSFTPPADWVVSGQTLTVRLTVTNDGTNSVTLTDIASQINAGASALSYLSGPTPAPSPLAAGSAATYAWTYDVVSAAQVDWTFTATGFDGTSFTTAARTVAGPLGWGQAVLVPSVSSGPAWVGQPLTVVLTVSNSGNDAFNSSGVWSNTLSGGGVLGGQVIPVPWGPVTVPAGEARSFSWTYTPTSAGPVVLSLGMIGADEGSMKTRMTSTVTGLLVGSPPPASLASAISVGPVPALVGSPVTVSLTVTNTGVVRVGALTPSIGFASGESCLSLVGESPGTDLDPGQAATFSFTYDAVATGSVSLTASATGVDTSNGGRAGVSRTASFPVASQAAVLVSSLDASVDPQSLLPWQSFTIFLTVTNTGLSTASLITPHFQVNSGTSSLGLGSGPTPASIAALATGAGGTFAWTFTVTAPGPISFTFTAVGTDADSLAQVVSAQSAEGLVGYGEPALLASLTVTGWSVGQPVRITWTVTNAGSGTATAMTPSLGISQGSGLVSWVSGPSVPGPLQLTPGSTTTFAWEYNANGAGLVVFTASLSGWDMGTGLPRAVSRTVELPISPAARLTATLNVYPPAASVGQWVDVVLRVSNTGGLGANSVTGYLDVNTGASLLVSKGTPSGTQDIPAGASRFFTWTYSVSGNGTVSFTATGAGTEAGTGLLRTAAASAALYGQLVSALSIVPPLAGLSAGQWFEARLTVTNTGVNPVTSVLPWAQVNAGSAILTQIGSVSPAGGSPLAAGASQTFVWTYSTAGAGTVNLSFTATGIDGGGSGVSTGGRIAGSVGYGAGNLVAAIAITTTRTGGYLTVVVTVTNTGNNSVVSIVPSLAVTGGAGLVAARSGASPAGPFTLAPAAAVSVAWTFSATGPGPVSFEATFSGQDNGSGTPRSAVADGIATVLPPPASFTALVYTMPDIGHTGELVGAVLSLTNTGGSTATGVTWTIGAYAGGGLLVPVQGPVPPGPITLPAGAGYQIWWSYTATGPGAVAWTITASGTDSATGGPVAIAASGGMAILPPASLVASMAKDLGPALTGQWTRVYLTVTNSGSNDAIGVAPALQLNSNGALVTVVAAPAAAPIAAGANHTFAWTLSVNGGGIIGMTATATGLDVRTGQVVSASGSQDLGTAWGATLVSSLVVVPPSAAPGQWVQVRLSVTNTGTPAANGVVPSLRIVSGSALVAEQGSVAPAGPLSLTGGGAGKATFVWTYSVSGTGVVEFSASATGIDAITGSAVVGAGVGSLTAASGAVLAVAGALSPASPSVGQWALVTLTVTNTGLADAQNVTALGQLNAGGSLVTQIGVMTPAAPQTLTPGSSVTFSWTFSVSGAGVLNATATATGIDAATSNPIWAAATVNGTLRAASALVAALSSGPAPASVGQWIRVALTVTNAGGVDATGVTPAGIQLNAGAAALAVINGPLPAGPVALAAGSSTTFVWTYSVSGAAALSWTATAVGSDSGTGMPRIAAATAAQAALPASALVAALSVSPATASVGQWVRIALTITNAGGVNANAVAPAALPQWNAGAGLVAYQNGPLPAGPAVLAPGSSTTFVWTYSVSGAGVASMTATASGSDSGTGMPRLAAASGVLPVGANLVSQLAFSPSAPSVGQWVQVRLTVTNTGGVNATGVGPFISVNSGGTRVALISPAAGSLTLGPGSGTTFSWTYSMSGAGAVEFTATAVGTDSATSSAIVTAKTGAVSAVAASSLAAALSIGPASPSAGQWFQVMLTVTNTGGVNATGVGPALSVNVGGTRVAQISGTAGSLTLVPGGSTTFSWTWSVSGAGAVEFTATAGGADSGTGLPVAAARTASMTTIAGASLAAVVSVSPPTASVSDIVTIALTVTNTGGVNATVVTPAAQPQWNAGAGLVSYQTGPTPSGSVTLNPGAGQTFVWTYQVTAAGVATMTVTATGTDAGNGHAIAGAASNVLPVGAYLVSKLEIAPSQVSVGQWFRVMLTVSNTGGVSATSVGPYRSVNVGGGLIDAILPPSGALTIPAGSGTTFVWTYSASGAGTVEFTATAVGTDSGSGLPILTAKTQSFSVLAASQLVATMDSSPSPASVGQWVRVMLTVTNTGGVAANFVTPVPQPQVNVGAANLAFVNGPLPAGPVALAAGSGTTFVWTYSVSGAGTVGWTATAGGLDSGNGQLKWAAATAGQTTLAAASLVASASIQPSPASVGQWITVVLSVTNTGGVTATSVTPAIQLNQGGVLLTPNGSPSAASIAPGANAGFAWTYSVAGAGTVNLTATGVGTDSGTGRSVVAAGTASVSISAASSLAAALSVAPSGAATPSVGQWIQVRLTVTNTGGVSVDGLTPVALPQWNVGAGLVEYQSGPTPAGPGILGASAAQTFVWTYSVSGAGAIAATATVFGTDMGSGADRVAAATRSVTVLGPASLAAAAAAYPSPRNVNQGFLVTLTVTNAGGVAVSSLAAAPFLPTGVAATASAGPTPAIPGTLAAGASATFTWTFSGASAGAVVLSTTVTGLDANTAGALVAQAVTGAVTIQRPAALSATLVVFAAQVSTGQSFLVTLTVTNTGDATANLVDISGLVKSGAGNATATAGPNPALPLATLAGGASRTFTWTYSGAAAGTLTLSTNVGANDANTGVAVPGVAVTTCPITVQSPAVLSGNFSVPASRNAGQSFVVTLRLFNTGGADATGTLATLPFNVVGSGADSGLGMYSDGPYPAMPFTIPGGTNRIFTWTYTGTLVGNVLLTTTVTATDANSGAPLAPLVFGANQMSIQAPASLTAGIGATAGPVNQGDAIVVTMTVNNTGGASAVSASAYVTPSAAMVSLESWNAGPMTVAGGSSTTFTWTYRATSSGSVSFSSFVAAMDANSGAGWSASPSTGAVVITAAAVLEAAAAAPSTVTAGDTFVLSVTVTNTGDISGTLFCPTVQVTGSGQVEIVSAPSASSSLVLVPPLGTTFIWQLRAVAAGAVTVTVNVAGRECSATPPGPLRSDVATLALTVEAAQAPASSVTVAQGRMLVAPNLLDLGQPGASMTFYARGTPNASVEVRIYDAAGGYMGAVSIPLDATGFGSMKQVGNKLADTELGSGVYWALPSGGAVSGRKPFMVQGRRK